jgi:hypothetical protein
MAAQLWSTWSAPSLFTAANYVGTGGANTRGPAAAIGIGDGVNAISAIFSTKGTTVTASVSDVIYLALLPENAIVIAGNLCGKGGATGTNVKIGISAAGTFNSTGQANDGVFLASTALAARAITQFGAAGGMPFAMPAITAATYPKVFGLIATVVAGTMTVSLCFGVNLIYTTANQGAK